MSATSRPSSTTRHKHQILTVQESLRSSVLHGSRSFGQRRRLLIVKFGGSSLSNPERISLAVSSVEREMDELALLDEEEATRLLSCSQWHSKRTRWCSLPTFQES